MEENTYDAPPPLPPASKQWERRSWGRITAVLGLLLLLFLGRALLPGQVLLPLDIVTQQWPPWLPPGQADNAHNPLLSDVVAYIYPVKEFAAAALRSGEFPLWNPYVLTGYPFTYNTQAGLFYPLTLLYLLFAAPTAVDLTILLQMVLGGLFMLLFLREIGLHPAPALAGAVIFLFNGLMVVWLQWQVVHAAVIWLPLALFFTEKLANALQTGQRRQAHLAGLGTAVALALPWLGGHWNWSLYMTMTGVIYLVARVGRQGWQGPAVSRRLWPAAWPALLAAALALIAVLPAVNYLARSHRQDVPFAATLQYGLLNRGVALLIPRFFGDPVSRTWWGFDNFNETTFYAGVLPLFLVAAAVLLRRDWHTRFFALWGLLGLGWALGPLYATLYVLPVFGGLQPNRAAILVVVCASVLAALGLDRLLKRPLPGHSWRFVLFPVSLLLVATIYGLLYRGEIVSRSAYLLPQVAFFLLWLVLAASWMWLAAGGRASRGILGALALLLIAVDLFWFGYDYNPVRPLSELYPATAVDQFLKTDPEGARMVTPPQGLAYPPNTSLVPRLPNLSGYEPGLPATLVAYLNAAEGSDAVRFERKLQPQTGLRSPLLDALNVKHVVTSADIWGAAEAVGPRPLVAAWSAAPAEIIVTAQPAGLQRIDVPLRGSKEMTLRVLSADGVHEFAHAAAMPAGAPAWTTFYVDPFPAAWGDSFLLRIEGEGEVGFSASAVPAVQTYTLSRPNLVFEEGKTRVYVRDEYFPRAYLVSRANVAADASAALAGVLREQEHLREVVLLELMGQAPPPGLSFAPGEGRADVTAENLSGLEVTAVLTEPAFLVLSDAWYPGWQASVDGQRTPVYRANSVSRAIYLPAGQHTVQFRFRPADFYIGATVSAIAWVGVLGWLLWYGLRGRRA